MTELSSIRNFSIVAHIDHGKSTLADRLIQFCGGLTDREMKEQVLDSMELERERGITIKAQTVRLSYKSNDGKTYILNIMDTPGHVDFSYEVSRSLSACEGVILIVDATQGLEAQSIAHTSLAKKLGLEIIPVINKIDLPSADVDSVKDDLSNLLKIDKNSILEVSAKTGAGVEKILPTIISSVPEPASNVEQPLRAYIVDSWFDNYLGIVVLIKIIDGKLKLKNKIKILSNKKEFIIDKLGFFTPQISYLDELTAGDVGFMTASIKTLDAAPIGDTISDPKNEKIEPLPGFQDIQPRVFSGFYPVDSKNYQDSKKALDKLSLNDNSFTYEPENSLSLGHGFRCGFLGLLHMEIIRERLNREHQLDFLMTVPSVTYKILTKDEKTINIKNPKDMPAMNEIKSFMEPIALIKILTPAQYLGAIIELCTKKEAAK